MPNTIATTTLHFKEGGSDKVYVPAIVDNPAGGFDVTASYGRRGATLQYTVKATNVAEAKARKTYDKLVSEKVVKGYRPLDGDATAVAAVTERDGRAADVPIQLLNAVTQRELHELLENPSIVVLEKKDGERRLLVIRDDDVAGVNRKGLYVPLPPAIVAAARALPSDTILDGELIGDVFYAFDALRVGGIDVVDIGFQARYDTLRATLAQHADLTALALVPCIVGDEREPYAAVLRDAGAEGIVLRHAYGKYTSGRPSSGGTALKYKFYSTASVVVAAHNDRHSVTMAVYDDGVCRHVGSVTIAPSQSLPAIGAIIEVRYLYAYRDGSLYQPTFLSIRTDLDGDDCTASQLSYKAEVAA